MTRIDLRAELPPYGYQAQDIPVPDIDFARFDFDQHTLDPRSETIIDVFRLPTHPDLVVRRHLIMADDLSEHQSLQSYLSDGGIEFHDLASKGIPVVPIRHLEARLPDREESGILLSVSPRLSAAHERLRSNREEHLPYNLIIIRGLIKYLKEKLILNPTIRHHFLSDIFEAEQYSIDMTRQIPYPILHDNGLQLDAIYEDGTASLTFCRAVGELTEYAETVAANAHTINDRHMAWSMLHAIKTDLPKPFYI